ncbi:MAG: XrtA system polysaccharide deacetylase [Thermodesulfobacteriota bacterium]
MVLNTTVSAGKTSISSDQRKSILLTFDVEDWFQVENFKEYIEFSTWNSFELRVEKSTRKILDLLDEFPFKPKATFFILGWIAEKLPGLVREIRKRGHETASHGVSHHLCTDLAHKDLVQDLTASREILESITGSPVTGYRAPSFAVNNKVLDLISDAGYEYDSSYNSFSGHGRYGTLDLSAAEKKEAAWRVNGGFYEIPVSNTRIGGKVIPLGGGGYFRLFPFAVFRKGIKAVLKDSNAFVFYAHPWEFDPDQPRVTQASKKFKFRHYINLSQTEHKLRRLIQTFSHCSFLTCAEYISRL